MKREVVFILSEQTYTAPSVKVIPSGLEIKQTDDCIRLDSPQMRELIAIFQYYLEKGNLNDFEIGTENSNSDG